MSICTFCGAETGHDGDFCAGACANEHQAEAELLQRVAKNHLSRDTGSIIITSSRPVKRVLVSAAGPEAESIMIALECLPGGEEYETEPCPTGADPEAVLLTLGEPGDSDGGSILVEADQWVLTPCENFLTNIGQTLHHSEAARLGHLLLRAAAIARAGEERA